jgi:hypothetical protein
MEKLLTIDFWKKLKFASKTDGLAFLHSSDSLLNLFSQSDLKLDSLHQQLKSELFHAFQSPDLLLAKNSFIASAKIHKKITAHQTLKDSAKHDAKIELILEPFSSFLPSAWNSHPLFYQLYSQLALSSRIHSLKHSTLLFLKQAIEHKIQTDNNLDLLFSKLCDSPLTPPTSPL